MEHNYWIGQTVYHVNNDRVSEGQIKEIRQRESILGEYIEFRLTDTGVFHNASDWFVDRQKAGEFLISILQDEINTYQNQTAMAQKVLDAIKLIHGGSDD